MRRNQKYLSHVFCGAGSLVAKQIYFYYKANLKIIVLMRCFKPNLEIKFCESVGAVTSIFRGARDSFAFSQAHISKMSFWF